MSIRIEEAYQHCPRCAAEAPEPGKVPFRCQHCGFTHFFGPVAAVGALIIDGQDRLLLVRRARDPGKGMWGLPGGFVDQDETVEQALNREIYEETRLELDSLSLLVTYPNEYNYRGVVSPVIDLFYCCRASEPGRVELEPAELDDYVWVRPTDQYLDNMAFPSNRRAIEFWMDSGAG
ncbi:NUDIX domain-containing protein [Roseiconus nitratireducens]|uniref:NUDIX domain-containing protein n=1 Tax=Roseiconus nitratireducens TaxID=2605748 RepID=A0A5M6DFQ9_9BACT|nr:NUDIX domain-containing protein [Roseiconus nitratireducens]KAA5545180.1 NUDIX domain-containing protein [Roseiconus nitratireducens]